MKNLYHFHRPQWMRITFSSIHRHLSQSLKTKPLIETETNLGKDTDLEVEEVSLKEVEGGDKLIYSGALNTNMKMIKYFSLTTSAIALSCQPLFLEKALNTGYFAFAVIGVTGIGIISSPILLNLLSKRYVIELYFDEKRRTFTAYTLNFFNRKAALAFKAEEVSVPPVPGMFTSFLVNKRPLFVDGSQVTDLSAYKHLMGFDKPLDVFAEVKSGEKE